MVDFPAIAILDHPEGAAGNLYIFQAFWATVQVESDIAIRYVEESFTNLEETLEIRGIPDTDLRFWLMLRDVTSL